MLNKQITWLSADGIADQDQLADFLTKTPDRVARFSPRLLRCRQWRRLVDLLLYYQTQNSSARAETALVQTDWIDPALQPSLDMSAVQQIAEGKANLRPIFSFVVPFRDRTHTLHLMLQGLLRQNTAYDFEIILVDDGSQSEPTPEIIETLHQSSVDWRILQLPPCRFFRAGFARNVGAIEARGEFLVFLDSDVVVAADFLDVVARELTKYDLVQGQRWQIWEDEWRDATDIVSLHPTSRAYDEPNSFWRDFQTAGTDWMDLPQPWRYISSNCLAIPREKFLALAGFRHWYSEYGFEDTDLGYRAWQQGLRFGRSQNAIFHLTSSSREDWVRFLVSKRTELLKMSARKFLLINRPMEAMDWLVHLVL